MYKCGCIFVHISRPISFLFFVLLSTSSLTEYKKKMNIFPLCCSRALWLESALNTHKFGAIHWDIFKAIIFTFFTAINLIFIEFFFLLLLIFFVYACKADIISITFYVYAFVFIINTYP